LVTNKWAYEMTDQELVDEFMDACARAGASNSGLVIDFSAGSDRAEAHYFKGVLLARLAGMKPPLKPGCKMVPLSNLTRGAVSVNYDRDSFARLGINPGEICKVRRILYVEGKWQLCFEGREKYRFKIEDFEPRPDEITKVA
jgi:hypothetical protein